ncbi:MAG: hypothetical protein ACLGPL_11055 [Acidobacteriota bacterium]
MKLVCHVLVFITMLWITGCAVSFSVGQDRYDQSPEKRVDVARNSKNIKADPNNASAKAQSAPLNRHTGSITKEVVDNIRMDYQNSIIEFKNGQFSNDDEEGYPLYATIYQKTLGDINGDGLTDAVFLYAESGGGSGSFHNVCAIIATKGEPIVTNSIEIGDRIQVDKVGIAKNSITLNMRTHGDGQGFADEPSLKKTLRYKVVSNKLVEAASKGKRK